MTIEEYFKQNNLNENYFDEDQMYEIRQGLKENLDVSQYSNPKYGWLQMQEIRENLLNQKYKVYEYLESQNFKKENFDKYQISQIRWGLEENLDVSHYAHPKFDSYQMNEIRKELKQKQLSEPQTKKLKQ